MNCGVGGCQDMRSSLGRDGDSTIPVPAGRAGLPSEAAARSLSPPVSAERLVAPEVP